MIETQHLSKFTYKTRLIGEGGFSLRVGSQLNYVFGMQIRSITYEPRGFLPGTYGTVRNTDSFRITDEKGGFKILVGAPTNIVHDI